MSKDPGRLDAQTSEQQAQQQLFAEAQQGRGENRPAPADLNEDAAGTDQQHYTLDSRSLHQHVSRIYARITRADRTQPPADRAADGADYTDQGSDCNQPVRWSTPRSGRGPAFAVPGPARGRWSAFVETCTPAVCQKLWTSTRSR